MRAVHGYCHPRGVSVSKPFPKLIVSSHRKGYEWHEDITLQAARFRWHVNHAEELQAEYSVVKITLRRQPPRSPHEHVRAGVTASVSAMCSGGCWPPKDGLEESPSNFG